MTPRALSIIFALLGAAPGIAAAQTYTPPAVTQTNLPVVSIDREFFASVDGMSTDYQEHVPQGVTGHDRESGWTPGFGVGARWMGSALGVSNVYLGVAYHRQAGNIDYTGSSFTTGAKLRFQSGLTTNDVTGELGRGFLVSPRLLVVPSVEIGFHDWRRDIGYVEDYSHVMVGGTVHANYAFTGRLVGTVRLGIAGMIDPQVDVHDQGVGTQPLGGKPIYQAGGRLEYALSPQLRVFTAGDVTHFDYSRSAGTPIGGGQYVFEPSSTTTNVVVSGGLAYGF